MCRSIKVLRRPGDAATPEELSSAALQFVRKISGFHRPSKANEQAFERAVREIAESSDRLLRTIAASNTRSVKRSGIEGAGMMPSADSNANPGQ
jgi:hypothetical protein